MKNYKNFHKVNGELTVRDMNEKARKVYDEGSWTVVAFDGKYDILEGTTVVYDQVSFEEMEEIFESLYDELYSDEEE